MPQPAHKHVTPDEAYDSFTWFNATTTLPEKEGLKYMTRYDENQDEISKRRSYEVNLESSQCSIAESLGFRVRRQPK